MNGSIIWRWFAFKELDDQQQNIFCREFQKPVATNGLSTRNLFHHLQQRHKVEHEEFVQIHAETQTTKPLRSSAPKQTLLQTSFTKEQVPVHQLITESTERAFSKVLSSDKKNRPLADTEVLQTIKEALKPLPTTVSRHLKAAILSCANPPGPGLFEYRNSKYADPSTSDVLDIASLLETRVKARHISGEKLDARRHKVNTEAESLPSGLASCLPEPADQSSLASFFERTSTTTSTTRTHKDAVEAELSS